MTETLVSIVWLITFWLMQAGAQVLFKYGSLSPQRWLLGFLCGNVLGASSIWLLMLLYRSMQPSIALGLGSGGGFICAQLAVALLFKAPLNLPQFAAMLAIGGGMAVFVMSGRT